MLDILNHSAARSGVVALKAPAVFKRDFATNFSVKWLEKDIALMVESAADLGVPLPLTALSHERKRFKTHIPVGTPYNYENTSGIYSTFDYRIGLHRYFTFHLRGAAFVHFLV
jgi:hypothetical protein